MPSAQNLSVIIYIELFVGALKILNQRKLMMEYCLRNKAYKKRELVSFCRKAYMQRNYPQFLCQNPRILHVPLDAQDFSSNFLGWIYL